MIKELMFGMLLMNTLHAEKPAGFLWYNLPKPQLSKPSRGFPFKHLSYTEQDAVLKFYTMEALHKVRFTHRLQDERVFLAWQAFWLREASIHGRLNQMALRYYPQYDFSVLHPSSSLGTQLSDSFHLNQTKRALKELAAHYGILLFYRGKHPLDKAQIPIVLDFCRQYHFNLIPITVDGVKSSLLPQSRFNQGQAERLQVHYFPAMLLVNPKANTTIPLAFGLATQDVLIERLMTMLRGGR